MDEYTKDPFIGRYGDEVANLKDESAKNIYGGQFTVGPTLLPTSTVSVNMPVIDPIFGTPSYIQGPPINLAPNNIYGQRKLTVRTPSANVNVYGNARQLLDVMQRLSLAKQPTLSPYSESPCADDFGYQNVTEKNISNVIGELQSSINPTVPQTNCPPGFQPATGPSLTSGWSIMQVGGTNRYILVSNMNNIIKYYSGSGIMVFERLYRSQTTGREEPAVILFRSSLTGEYEELGGSIDPIDFSGENTLLRTAKREAKEESCGLFDFDRVDITSLYGGIGRNIDREAAGEIYRCYAICLAENQGNDQWQRMYDYNRMKINMTPAPSSWKETNDMRRFFLSDLVNCISSGTRGSITTTDAEGYPRTITGRTKAVLKSMLQGYMFTGMSVVDAALSNARSVVNTKNSVIDNARPYLTDTFTVIVS